MRRLDERFAGFAEAAVRKAEAMRDNPLGFTIAAAFAGAYVGAGILLIFSVGQPLDPAWRPLVMGASFGIALTLVVFAGSELFTGHTLTMTIGRLDGKTLLLAWVWTWLGNLLGACALAGLFVLGGGKILAPGATLLAEVATAEAESGPLALLARGDALQLAGVPRGLDGGAEHERRRPLHPDLLVPVRLHRLWLRALGGRHDDFRDRPVVGRRPGARARRHSAQSLLGESRQHDRRGARARRRLCRDRRKAGARGGGRSSRDRFERCGTFGLPGPSPAC
jgi:hypothetical protein